MDDNIFFSYLMVLTLHPTPLQQPSDQTNLPDLTIMADPSFLPPYDGPPWQMPDLNDPFDIEQARPNLQHSPPHPQQDRTQPMQDAFLAIEQAAAEVSSPWTGTALSYETPHSRAPFDQDTIFPSSPSRMIHQRSPFSANPSSRTRGGMNPHVTSQSRSSMAQNQDYAYSPSPMGTRPIPLDVYSPPQPVMTSSSSRAKTQQLPTEMESSIPSTPTPFPLDSNPQLEPSQLLSSMPALGTTYSRRALSLGRSSARPRGDLGHHLQSQMAPSPRTPTRVRGRARTGSQRMQGPQAHSVSPSDHPNRSIHTPSRGDENMQSSHYVPSATHGAALPSLTDLADTIFEHHLQNFVAEHQILEQDVAVDVIAEFKHRASTEAWKILALPPLELSSKKNPQQRLQQKQSFGMNQPLKPSSTSAPGRPMPGQVARGQNPQPYESASPSWQPQPTSVGSETALGKARFDSEGSHELAKTHQSGSAAEEDSNQLPSAPTEPEVRSKVAKIRLMKIITQINIAYAQRVVNDPRFQRLYAVGMQTIVAALFNVLALGTGLQEIIVHVWAVNDVQLLELVRFISPQLRAKLPMVRAAIKSYLEPVADRETRWVAANKTTTMFYDSFSGLKAALKERDRRRGDRKSIFIDALGIDRSHVWDILRPGRDDELDGRMAGEMADAQARTPSGTRASLKELEDLQDQYLADLVKGQERPD